MVLEAIFSTVERAIGHLQNRKNCHKKSTDPRETKDTPMLKSVNISFDKKKKNNIFIWNDHLHMVNDISTFFLIINYMDCCAQVMELSPQTCV
jgi:hypothetical protein